MARSGELRHLFVPLHKLQKNKAPQGSLADILKDYDLLIRNSKILSRGKMKKIVSLSAVAALVLAGLGAMSLPSFGSETKKIVVSGFASNSSVLSSAMRSKVTEFVAANPDYSNIRCTGYSDAPGAVTLNSRLGKKRADAVCSLAESLDPGMTVETKGRWDKINAGPNVRRVVITLSNPAVAAPEGWSSNAGPSYGGSVADSGNEADDDWVNDCGWIEPTNVALGTSFFNTVLAASTLAHYPPTSATTVRVSSESASRFAAKKIVITETADYFAYGDSAGGISPSEWLADPYLCVINGDSEVLAQNDDVGGSISFRNSSYEVDATSYLNALSIFDVVADDNEYDTVITIRLTPGTYYLVTLPLNEPSDPADDYASGDVNLTFGKLSDLPPLT